MDWLIRLSGMETPEAQCQWNPHEDPHISAFPLRAGLPRIQSWKGPLGSASSLHSLQGSRRGTERGRELWALGLLEAVPTQVPACLLPLGSGTLSGHSVKARASPTTVSPSGAMIPNPGSPEAATMRGWQPQALRSLQPTPIRTVLREASAELCSHTGLRDLWAHSAWRLSFLTSLLPLSLQLTYPIQSVPHLGGGRFRILSPDRIIQ